jgi:hypothetical protein
MKILELQPSAALQARLKELLEKNRSGGLSSVSRLSLNPEFRLHLIGKP